MSSDDYQSLKDGDGKSVKSHNLQEQIDQYKNNQSRLKTIKAYDSSPLFADVSYFPDLHTEDEAMNGVIFAKNQTTLMYYNVLKKLECEFFTAEQALTAFVTYGTKNIFLVDHGIGLYVLQEPKGPNADKQLLMADTDYDSRRQQVMNMYITRD